MADMYTFFWDRFLTTIVFKSSISTFRGGWHHVEVHEEEWWIRKFEGYGFRFDPRLTDEIRQLASEEKRSETIFPPNGETLNAQHIYTSMKVFINPVRTQVIYCFVDVLDVQYCSNTLLVDLTNWLL